MAKKLSISYNPFFFIPFLLWLLAGGILIESFTRQVLFSSINSNYNDTADTLMYYISWMGEGEIIIPMLAVLLLVPRFRNWWYFVTALLCNIIPFFIQQILKTVLDMPRPFKYFHNAPWIHYLHKWPYLSDRSFPSGHSEGAFSFFCFLSLLLPQKHRLWGLLFFLLAFAVCYSRIYLTAHFFNDVYAGSIVGAVTTTLIFSVMANYKDSFSKKETA